MISFLGRTLSEWEDIYRVMCLSGTTPKNLTDLFSWVPPENPKGCLVVAQYYLQVNPNDPCPVRNWIYGISCPDNNGKCEQLRPAQNVYGKVKRELNEGAKQ